MTGGGNLLEEEYLFGLRYTYTYDADGLRVKTAHGDRSPGSGKPIPPYVAQRDDNEYDASGSKIETVTYLRGDADPWSREAYEYDERGRMRRLSRYWRDSAKSLKLSHVVTYTYGVGGQEEEVVWRDAAGALMDRLSYSNYKYDHRGNWVERTEARFQVYDSRQPKEQWRTVYRVIIYY